MTGFFKYNQPPEIVTLLQGKPAEMFNLQSQL
jgi:hypothetical protein